VLLISLTSTTFNVFVEPQVSNNKKPSFREAFLFWLKLGFISFGGPAGQIAIMHQVLVDEKKWISDNRFLHGLNYCMILPGPEAQQLATYIGWLLHGIRGGLAAGILFILPSVLILLGLSVVYVLYGKLGWLVAIFYGLKPAIIAVVAVALVKIGKKSLLTLFHYGIAVASFACIFFFDFPFPLIIVFSVILGLMGQRYFPEWLHESKKADEKTDAQEQLYYLNKYSPPITEGMTTRSVILKTTTALLLWTVPIGSLLLLHSEKQFWLTLSLFFSKAALITFGGAYAVLPYIAQVSVEKFHWLNEYQMIDGLALGETTPGPLIMVLVFVGFMAGFNNANGSLLDGTLGLLTTTFYTFLPSFLFIFIGAPFVERVKGNTKLKSVLAIVTAGVVGVMLNLTIYLGKAVLFPNGNATPDGFALVWLVISFVALLRFRLNLILWIGVSALSGSLYHFLS
jgi:chromate transporter